MTILLWACVNPYKQLARWKRYCDRIHQITMNLQHRPSCRELGSISPSSKTSCTSVKYIMTWSKSRYFSSLEIARCGYFQPELRNSEVIVETLSPII
jgi:hypothetical protein